MLLGRLFKVFIWAFKNTENNASHVGYAPQKYRCYNGEIHKGWRILEVRTIQCWNAMFPRGIPNPLPLSIQNADRHWLRMRLRTECWAIPAVGNLTCSPLPPHPVLLSQHPRCVPEGWRPSPPSCLNSCSNKMCAIFYSQFLLSVILLSVYLFSLSMRAAIIKCLEEIHIFKAKEGKSLKLTLASWTHPQECYWICNT